MSGFLIGGGGGVELGGDLGGTPDDVKVVDFSMANQVRGSVLYFDGTKWMVLPPGTNGYILTTSGAGGIPAWAANAGGGGGSFTAAGDLSGSGSLQTVIRINGATVPVAGLLTTGNILRVTGNASLAYGSLDLSNSNSVTGVLSDSNLPDASVSAEGVIKLSGDLAGTAGSVVVAKINGTSVPVGGSLDIGSVLIADSSSSLSYGSIDLSNANSVTGKLGDANLNNASTGNKGIIQLAGDLSGTATDVTVTRINKTSVPAGGSLVTGQILRATGMSSLSYGALDLANANAVTGVLGVSNIPSATTGAKGVVQLAGDLSGTSTSVTVSKINGASVPVAGSLVVGQLLRATDISTLDYGAVDLANSNAVTGVLGTTNLPSASISVKGIVQLAGDLAGTSTGVVVAKINGSTVPAGGSLTTGNILKVSGSGSLAYGALDLSLAASVSGILSSSNLPDATTIAKGAIQLSGDLAGTSTAVTVAKINGSTVPAGGALVTGSVLRATGINTLAYGAIDLSNSNSVTGTLNNSNLNDASTTVKGIVQLTGDLSGSSTNVSVIKINGSTVPAGGSLVTGTVLRATGTGALGYGALDLANASAVTGVLPAINHPDATTGAKGLVQLTGDIGGTNTSVAVTKVNGASVPGAGGLTTGNVLRVNGLSSLSYGTVDLSSSNSVSGVLGPGNLPDATTLAKGSVQLAGDIAGTNTSVTVAKINGASVPVSGSLVAGNVLRVSGISALSYGPLDLSNANTISGVLASANLADATTSVKGAVQLAGDLAGTNTSVVVAKINGAVVPASGSLVTGNILRVSGTTSLSYGALDLSNTNSVSGILAAGNLPDASTSVKGTVQLAGDIAGTNTAVVVAKVNGASVPASGALATGNVLRVTGVNSLGYGAIDLSSTNAVTGTLSNTNLPDATTGAKGIVQLSGDLAGTATSVTVAKLNGSSVPVGGSLVTGTVLRATGTSALSYGALDLANSNAVTGVLPSTNLFQATNATSGAVRLTNNLGGTSSAPTVVDLSITSQAIGSLVYFNGSNWVNLGIGSTDQLLKVTGGIPVWSTVATGGGGSGFTAGGDLSGSSTNQTVIKVNGATVPSAGSLVLGNVLTVTGSSTLGYAALDLSNTNSVTGILSVSNLPDASNVTKGVVQLSNNLGGTSTNPTVKDLTIASQAANSMLYFNGTNWVQLSSGITGQFLKVGGAGVPTWTNSSPRNSGTVELDFGDNIGGEFAQVVIIGQTGFTSANTVRLWMQGDTTSTHNDIEHQYVSSDMGLTSGSFVDGVGFTITGITQNLRLSGTFLVHWDWR